MESIKKMKKLLTILLTVISLSVFGQAQSDASLSTQSTDEIKNKALNQTRIDAFNQDVIQSKSSNVPTANTQTGSYTFALTDIGKVILMNVGSANDLTVPPNASVAFPTNTMLVAYQIGAGQTTIQPGAGVTINNTAGDNDVPCQGCSIVLYKTATNTWTLSNGLAGGGSGEPSDGDKGDITVSSSGTVWDIDANTVGATELATISSSSLAGKITDETGTAGALVFSTSPTLTTPNLGTPSTLVGTNITGTASGLTAGTVTTNANLTGHVTSTGNAAVLGSFSSSNLSTALTDEVGTGSAVFSEPDVNVQTGSYTLVLTDKAKEVRMNVAGSNNLTVPLNSSVAFPIGTLINISQYGAGTTTVVATGGVTINSSAGNLLSPGQFSPMILRKIGTDEWYLWNGAAAVTAAFTRTNGTYITTTLSGSMSGALNTAVDITVDLTGVVPLTLGGTGASSATQTYTPTFTNTTNVAASTPRACQYMRVGNTITVSGQFDIDPTATGQIVMGISLPVASAFTTAFQAGGTAAPTTVADAPAAIISDATNDRATLTYVCVDTTNHTMAFTFTYQVL